MFPQRIISLILAVAIASSTTAWAADEYQQGIEAYASQDYAKARGYWEQAVAQGNISAAFNLGILLSKGLGGSRDSERATNLFRRAADAGLAAAQHNMALAYYQGDGVMKNARRAKIWWERAAQQDHVQAQYNLGAMLWNGDGVSEEPSEGLKWFRKAAANGNTQAQAFLDQVFEKMSLDIDATEEPASSQTAGTAAATIKALEVAHQAYREKNYKLAYQNWSYAANNGHFGAQYQLARLYQSGLGVEADIEHAFELFKSSALAGQPQAQFQLGQYYLNGELVEKNETLALYWIQSAADKNDIMAKDYLEQLR